MARSNIVHKHEAPLAPHSDPATEVDALIEREALAQAQLPDDKLQAIVAAAEQLRALQESVAATERALKELQAKAERLSAKVLPALMDEVRVRKLELADGTQLIRDEQVEAYISTGKNGSADNRPAACAWLIANGFADLVKAAFAIAVPKGDAALAARIKAMLEEQELEYEQVQTVHPQTLGAFVRESLRESRALPDSISIHIQPLARLKAKRKDV